MAAPCLGDAVPFQLRSRIPGQVPVMARPPGLQRGWRERDVDGQTAARPGLRGDGGGVRGSDGADNGEAQTVTAVWAGGARAEPLEGLEQAVDLGGRDDLPGAGYRQDGVNVGGPSGDADVPAGDVVPDGVVDQVGGELLKQQRVAVEGGGLEVGLDMQA